MSKPKLNPDSVFQEPHLNPPAEPEEDEKSLLDSVWMEPAHPRSDDPAPYQNWLREQFARRASASSWVLTFILSLVAGPLAVVSVFITGNPAYGALTMVVAGPVIEEMGKIVAPLVLMERNPAHFLNRTQLLLCALASGLLFAVIENFLYLKVYIPNPSPTLIAWRWSVCVVLHAGCSLIAGLGLARMWSESREKLIPPSMKTGSPYLIVAAVIHGAYNFIAILIDHVF